MFVQTVRASPPSSEVVLAKVIAHVRFEVIRPPSALPMFEEGSTVFFGIKESVGIVDPIRSHKFKSASVKSLADKVRAVSPLTSKVLECVIVILLCFVVILPIQDPAL